MKTEKGITLVSLIITIVVLIIIASTTVYTSLQRFEINNYKKMINDIELLNDKVSNYYLKFDVLPIVRNNEGEKIVYDESEFEFEKNLSDNENYYVIDLSAMDGILLNYGKKGYQSVKNNLNIEEDVYIINENTHIIYYVKGVEMDGVVYHYIDANTQIILNNIPPSKPQIKVISGEKNEIGKYITNVEIAIEPGKDKNSQNLSTDYTITKTEDNNNVTTINQRITETTVINLQDVANYSIVASSVKSNDIMSEIAELNLEINSTYTEFTYIESTGTQYIDTGYKISNNSKIETKFVSKTLKIGGEMVYGVENGISTFISTTSTFQNFGSQIINRAAGYWDSDTEYIISLENGEEIVNGITTSMTLNDNFLINNNLYVFARNNQEIPDYKASVKLYYFNVYESGELVMNLVPAKRDFDGQIGLLDKKNNKFYKNLGEGEFEYGNETNAYSDIEYIDSTGTQYIDTGYKISNASQIETKFASKTLNSIGEMVFGVKDSTKRGATTFISTAMTYQVFGEQMISRAKGYWSSGTEYTVVLKEGEQTVNGTSTVITSNQEFNINNNLYIFARNNVGSAEYKAAIRLYYFKIYENGVEVLNLTPAIRISDQKKGLLDKEKNKFYINIGTGDFE